MTTPSACYAIERLPSVYLLESIRLVPVPKDNSASIVAHGSVRVNTNCPLSTEKSVT